MAGSEPPLWVVDPLHSKINVEHGCRTKMVKKKLNSSFYTIVCLSPSPQNRIIFVVYSAPLHPKVLIVGFSHLQHFYINLKELQISKLHKFSYPDCYNLNTKSLVGYKSNN